MGFAGQMVAVAVGWQVYAIHRNPFDLGLIGLVEFVPLPLLALPAGAARRPRLAPADLRRRARARRSPSRCALVVVSLCGADELWPFLALAVATGVAGRPRDARRAGARRPSSCRRAARRARWRCARSPARRGRGRPRARRPALRRAARARLRQSRPCCSRGAPRRACSRARAAPRRALTGPRRPGWRVLGRDPLHPRHAGSARRDLARPLRRALRRRGGAAAGVRALDPPHRPGRARRPAQRAGRRRARAPALLLTRRPLGAPRAPTLLVVVAAFGVSMVVFGLSRWFRCRSPRWRSAASST